VSGSNCRWATTSFCSTTQWPDAFTWEHLVNGPDEVRVKIIKLKAAALIDAAPECSAQ
jgi:uncharacterized protein (DUF2249 family)